MIYHDHQIVLPTLHQTVQLVALGCVHEDSETFRPDLFRRAVEYIAETPNCYAIGAGDYWDLARSAYRTHQDSYQRDRDSRKPLDRAVRAQVQDSYRTYWKKIQHKVIGLAEGNHHWRFGDDTTSSQMLCRLMEVPYLAVGSWTRLHLTHKNGNSIRMLKMFLHHGNWGGGGGRTKGASRNQADSRSQGQWADILVYAHDHQADAWLDPWDTCTDKGQPGPKRIDRLFIRAGTFMEGLSPKCVTYVERAQHRPVAPGFVVASMVFEQAYDPALYARTGGRSKTTPLQMRYEHKIIYG